MNIKFSSICATLLAAGMAVGVAGCKDDQARQSQATKSATSTQTASTQAPARTVCQDCGTIAAIEPVEQKGDGTGAGAVAGAVVGGVVGHQFGQGRGKDAATAAGAVGGAVAGHQIEREIRSTTTYRVTVRMDDDSTRVVTLASPQGYSVGSKVRVVGGTLQPA